MLIGLILGELSWQRYIHLELLMFDNSRYLQNILKDLKMNEIVKYTLILRSLHP